MKIKIKTEYNYHDFNKPRNRLFLIIKRFFFKKTGVENEQ